MSDKTTSPDSDNFEDLLHDVAKSEGFCKYETKTTSGSVKGDGYTGIMNSVCITGEDETKSNKTINVIIKSAPASLALREQFPLESAFKRETHMYGTVFPALHAKAIEKNLPIVEFAPKFYKAQVTKGKEAVLLEDLKVDGFIMHAAKLPMNEEHVRLVLTKYAYLHALSFVMRDQNIEKFRKISNHLDDILMKYVKDSFFATVLLRCRKTKNCLKPELDGDVTKCYDQFLGDILDYLESIRGETDEYSVILHGDSWCNNMMFKYYNNEDLTKPSDARLLDYQLSRMGSPVLDLSYFFYSCISKELLDKLDYFMQFYHKSLCEYISKCGSDPEKLYPYRILQDHWKKYAKYGLILSTLAIHTMLTEKDETIDLSKIAETDTNLSNAFNYEIANIDIYNDRCRHIILHFYNRNLL